MIGNDLCFLQQHRSDERLERYLHKITTKNERTVLKPFDIRLQVPFAWSVKEASYKYYRRYKSISAHPKNFLVKDLKFHKGEACTSDRYLGAQGFSNIEHIESIVETLFGGLICKTIITKDFIHSVLCGEKELLEKTYWGVAKINATSYASQRNAVRKNAIDHLAKVYGKQSYFQFKKNSNNAPILFIDDVESQNDFSFSHDQNYVGYAWSSPSS